MSEIFGWFLPEIPPTEEYLTLSFSPSSRARRERWRNYGLSADFLGDYFSAFFPVDEAPDGEIEHKKFVRDAVSFVANELLENAIKYSDEQFPIPVAISLYLYETSLVLLVTNSASRQTADRFRTYAAELTTGDLDALYTRQLERAATGTGAASCLGLITMAVDYSVSLGWEFSSAEQHPDSVIVKVIARIEV